MRWRISLDRSERETPTNGCPKRRELSTKPGPEWLTIACSREIRIKFKIKIMIRKSAQPQINRPFYLGLEGEAHFLSGSRGVIRGVHDFEHGAAIFAGHQRLFIFPDAFDEVFQLLRIALVERFFKNGEGPALGRAGLFHCVAVAL